MSLSRIRDIVRDQARRESRAEPGVSGSAADADGRREFTYAPVDAASSGAMPADLASLNGAAWMETGAGRTLVVDRVFSGGQAYGGTSVEHGAIDDRTPLEVLRPRRPDRPSVPPGPGPIVFVDLETTGLSGGAGTVAFLIGCGWFEAGGFRVRQFVLPSLHQEAPLLHGAAEVLGDAGLLVTYNGNVFDLPVMETRWLFQRLDAPWDGVAHLDMLPPARRLWRRRDAADQSCRLTALEQALFGVRRRGDVPGWEIPGRYFHYIRTGDVAPLEPVLLHNQLDLLSLALVTARASRLVADAPDGADAYEALALGRLLGSRGDGDRADACFRCAAGDRLAPGEIRAEAMTHLARRLRRRRLHGDAAEVWRQVLGIRDAGPRWHDEAREALAVHHEHRERRLDLAHRLVRETLAGAGDARRRRAAGHRLARIERKLAAGLWFGSMDEERGSA